MSATIIMLIFSSIIFLTGCVYFVLKMRQTDEFKIRPNMVYLITAALLLTGISLLSFSEVKATSLYLMIHAVCILLGVLHSYAMYKLLEWSEKDSFLPELFFTLLIEAFGIIGFVVVSHFILSLNLTLLQSTAFFSFLLPLLVQKAYLFDLLIPDREFKKWHFPEEIKVMEKDIHEHLLINLVISKKNGSNENSIFTIRAPLHQNLGDVFCYFINGYNRQQEVNNEIQELDKDVDERLLGWLFYTKSRISGRKTYIDPDRSVKINGLKEKQIVYTKRVYS